MAVTDNRLKRFVHWIAPNAIWDIIKWIGGSAIMTSIGRFFWLEFHRSPIDWYWLGALVMVGIGFVLVATWGQRRRTSSAEGTDVALAAREELRRDFRKHTEALQVHGDLARCEEARRLLQAQVDATPKRKLEILSATYGSGKTFEPVDQYLHKKATDGLSARVDANLFDAYDPTPGVEKDLTVEYSFGNQPKRTIERHEKDWLTLPDDPEFCFSGLQRRVMKLAREIRSLILDNPPPPQPTPALQPEEATAQMLKYSEWNNRLAYCYESDFAKRVLSVKNAIGRKNPNLAAKLKPIPGASPPPSMFPDLAKVLWDLAWEIEEIQSEKTGI